MLVEKVMEMVRLDVGEGKERHGLLFLVDALLAELLGG